MWPCIWLSLQIWPGSTGKHKQVLPCRHLKAKIEVQLYGQVDLALPNKGLAGRQVGNSQLGMSYNVDFAGMLRPKPGAHLRAFIFS